MTELTEQMQPHKYQAFGTVEGILRLSDKHSTLLVGETAFPVISYIPKQVREFHLPGQLQQFKVFLGALHGKLAFKLLTITQSSELGLKLKGCWEKRWGLYYLVVYRNRLENPDDKVLRVLVPISWKDAPVPDGQYWQLEAEVEQDKLVVIKAEGPFVPPPKATPFIPRESANAGPSLSTTPSAPASCITAEDIRALATPAKVQLTCKLNQVPKYRERPDQQIEFSLSNGSAHIFTVQMHPRKFKKLTDHGFAEWVAAIIGELGSAPGKGFEILNPTIQIFEQKTPQDSPNKSKPPSQKTTAAAAVASPQPPKAEAHAGAGKRKSLLDGVKMM